MAKRRQSGHDASKKVLKKRRRTQSGYKDRSESIEAHRIISSTSTPTSAYQFVPDARQSCGGFHNSNVAEPLPSPRTQHEKHGTQRQYTAPQTKESTMSRSIEPRREVGACLISTPVDLQSSAEYVEARQASQQRRANTSQQFSSRVFSSSSSSSSPSHTTSSDTLRSDSADSSDDGSSQTGSTADDNVNDEQTATAKSDGTSKQKGNKQKDRRKKKEETETKINAKRSSRSTIPEVSYPALQAKYRSDTKAAAQARADFKAVQDSLSNLESIIPSHILAHTTESIAQTRKNPKNIGADNLAAAAASPHHSEVVLRAAHHLIVQLSFQKLFGAQEKDSGVNDNNGGTSNSGSTIHRLSLAFKGVEGVSEMELELLRIAREREQQILGLKAQITALKDLLAALKKGR